MSKGTTSQDAPFGTLLGYAPGGVAIYSSDYSSLDPRDYDDDAAFRSYIDDEYGPQMAVRRVRTPLSLP